jgi:hypothetical protein
MNRATATGLVVDGVSSKDEAAIVDAHAAFLRRCKLKTWSLKVIAKGKGPSVSVTSSDPDGTQHHLEKGSIATGFEKEIAQILDDHYRRYSQAHSAAKGGMMVNLYSRYLRTCRIQVSVKEQRR